jgi:hypothetical protein
MRLRRAPILDDAGAAFPAPAFRAGAMPNPDHPATRAMVARVGDEVFGHRRGCGLLVGWTLLLPVAFGFTCVGGGVVGYLTRSPLAGSLASVFLAVVAIGILIRFTTPDISQSLARHLPRVGRCGSCCHPLIQAPSSEGLTRCSECSAAWRSESVGTELVPPADLLGARRLDAAFGAMRQPRWRPRDRRGRFVQPRLPRARWMRGTPLAWAARRVRWTIAGINTIAVAAIVVAVIVTIAAEADGIGLWVLVGLFGSATIIAGVGQPYLVIAVMRRNGLCAACANPLDEDKQCGACGAAWGQRSAPPSGV